MEVVLDKQSFLAKSYKFVFGGTLPDNLCPFFWKSIIAFVVILATSPILALGKILGYILDEKVKKWSQAFAFGIFSALVLLVLFSIIIALPMYLAGFVAEKSPLFTLASLGIICIGIGLIVGIIYGLIEWHTRIEEKKIRDAQDGINTTNIFTSYIKSKYNKLCPKITWKQQK